MRTRAGIVGAVLAVGAWGAAASSSDGSEIVVFDNPDAPAGNYAPFSGLPDTGAVRSQQVYDASIFGDREGPVVIQSLLFRADGYFSAEVPGITVALSTTDRPVDGLSPVFAENVGADEAVVYRGPLPIFRGPSLPELGSMDVVVNLQEPFRFDPAEGNLLLDVLNPVGPLPRNAFSLVAAEQEGDAVSRVLGDLDPAVRDWENAYASEDVSRENPGARGNPDSLGLVTAFRIGGNGTIPQPEMPEPTPEPATWVAFGLIGVGLIARSRSKGGGRPDELGRGQSPESAVGRPSRVWRPRCRPGPSAFRETAAR
ncbi:hypothetical protein ElP_32970 [Tautonia plasticadhaerens]|uniref:PEP-CTERM protein-sorting domain-containing protein n=2 Tax=Tautonia plasticadhaerens TaxID=2527974 RepID=A0A518H3I1_9BACT|nr:hypothetical protein ElP_32970 [Tautonia plasticadhaerens]